MNKSYYMEMKFSKQRRERTGAYITCKTCKKEFYVFRERLKRKNPPQFCSVKCYDRTGKNNNMWGKKHTAKAIHKYMTHPKRYSFETGKKNPNIRFAAENKFFGSTAYWWKHHKTRKSSVCERCKYSELGILQVHHKDRNRSNNTFENIEILCPNCHAMEHYKKKDGPFFNMD